MYHNRGWNFDGSAIETKFRTAEIVASEDQVVRFTGFQIKGTPGSYDNTMTFRYWLDGRDSQYGQGDLDMGGERRTLGTIEVQMQDLTNVRVQPLTNYSRGTSISFSIEDNHTDTFLEFGSIAFNAIPRYPIRNSVSHIA